MLITMQNYDNYQTNPNLKQHKSCLKRYNFKIIFVYLHPICTHLKNICQYLLATICPKKAGTTGCTVLKQVHQ